MKTEDELKEFYYDVIHPDHIEPLGECDFRYPSSVLFNIYGNGDLCAYCDDNNRWYIFDWYTLEDYLSMVRTDLSDADKLALILKYT